MRRSALGAILAITTLISVSACSSADSAGGSETDSDPIVIGVINPITGPNAEAVTLVNNAFQLAVDQTNAEGGVDGQPLQLSFGDASTPDQAATTAQRLITEEKAQIITGTFASSLADIASQTAARYEIPYWETMAVADALTERDLPNFFRVGISSTNGYGECTKVGIPMMAEVLGKPAEETTVVLTHESGIYGTSTAEAQQAEYEAAGVKVLANIAYDPAATDFTSVILRIRDLDPDVWSTVPNPADGLLLYRSAQSLNYRPAMIWGIAQGVPSLLDGAGQAWMDGIFSCDYPFDLNPDFATGSQAYVDGYTETFGAPPTFSNGQTAYAGMVALIGVLDATKGDTTLQAFSDAAMAMDLPLGSLPTGSGVKFDENQQNTRLVEIIAQWQDGVYKTVWPKEAAPEGNAPLPAQ